MEHNYNRLTMRYIVIAIILFVISIILYIILVWILLNYKIWITSVDGVIDRSAFWTFLVFFVFLIIVGVVLDIIVIVFYILTLVNLFNWRGTIESNSKEKTILLVAIITWFFLLLFPVVLILTFLANLEAKKFHGK